MFQATMVKLGQQLNYTNQLLKEITVEYGDGVFGQPISLPSEMFVLSAEQVGLFLFILMSTKILTLTLLVDSSGNVQQEYPVWNYRGVMNNSWRTVDPHTIEMSNI